MSTSRLATELLPRVLDSMGALATRLEGAYDLEASADLEPLRLEVEELGWALSLLSAVGEGQPNLARHHRAGLRILLGLLYPDGERDLSEIPGLEVQPGAEFAWALLERLSQLAGALPSFEAVADHWRIHSALVNEGGLPSGQPGWFRDQGLTERFERGQWTLEVPLGWLHVRLTT